MTENARKEFRFDKIDIFQWYDGMVRAVAASGEQYHLLILVAWDPATNKRTYVLINLEPNVAKQIERLNNWQDEPELEGAWEQINELYRNSITSYDGPVYCLAEEPCAGKEFSAIRVPADLKELTNYELEQTMEPAAQNYWFNVK